MLITDSIGFFLVWELVCLEIEDNSAALKVVVISTFIFKVDKYVESLTWNL